MMVSRKTIAWCGRVSRIRLLSPEPLCACLCRKSLCQGKLMACFFKGGTNSPDHLQGPQARIPQNCCGDCCGNCRRNSWCWGECWENCCRDCREECRFSAPQSKDSPPSSLRSSAPSTLPSTPSFPGSFHSSLRSSVGESGLGGPVESV